MITLHTHDKERYFTLEDNQGADFACDVIFESIKEVKEQFMSWAESDGKDLEEFKKWDISGFLELWCFTLREWNGYTFTECTDDIILNYV